MIRTLIANKDFTYNKIKFEKGDQFCPETWNLTNKEIGNLFISGTITFGYIKKRAFQTVAHDNKVIADRVTNMIVPPTLLKTHRELLDTKEGVNFSEEAELKRKEVITELTKGMTVDDMKVTDFRKKGPPKGKVPRKIKQRLRKKLKIVKPSAKKEADKETNKKEDV